jgi:ribosomal protein S6
MEWVEVQFKLRIASSQFERSEHWGSDQTAKKGTKANRGAYQVFWVFCKEAT